MGDAPPTSGVSPESRLTTTGRNVKQSFRERCLDVAPTRRTATHPLPLVQKAAGHSSIKTTMGYVHLQDEDLNALISAPRASERTG
jgi:integrase